MLLLSMVSIPYGMLGAEAPEMQAGEAITLIRNARHNRTEGYFYRAEAQYRRALAILEQTSGAGSADLTPALNGLAELYFDAQRYSEAEALAQRSAAVVEANLGAGHPLLATALQDLAAIYHVQGQYAKAEPLYYRALAIREQALGPSHPFVASTLADRAAEHYARAVRIRQDAFGMDDPRVAETLSSYAAVLRKSCHKRDAASVEARSRAILAAR
jgi:tetratricopeptide (TPR) repeat protein